MKQFNRIKLLLPPRMDAATRRLAVEAAHLAGFHSVNMVFPVAGPSAAPREPETFYIGIGGVPGDFTFPPDAEGQALWQALDRELARLTADPLEVPVPQGLEAADGDLRVPLKPRREGGLEELFEPGLLLFDDDLDGLPDRVGCRLLLPEQATDAQVYAACDFAARLGMETTGVSYPLTAEADDGVSPLIRFRQEASPSVTLDSVTAPRVVTLEGDGEALVRFIADFCTRFPLASDHGTLSHAARELEEAVSMKSWDGQAAVLELVADGGPVTALLSADAPLDRLAPLWPDARLSRYTDLQPVFSQRHAPVWEVEEAREALDSALAGIRSGEEVQLWGMLSESREVRERLAADFTGQALAVGAAGADVRILCAYKPGLSWLEEDFAPRAAAAGEVRRVEIRFNPHIRPGAAREREADSPWAKVDGLVDKPPRWLQELYPVHDLIAPILGLAAEDILFEAYAGAEDITYEVLAFDGRGRCLLRDTLLVPVSEGFYLEDYPGQGVSAPATGWLRLVSGGRTLLDRQVDTDCQRLWSSFQKQVLPALREFILSKAGDGPPPMPVFGRLELEITVSEPERVLPFGDDILSMGEVLSEDLHMAGRAFVNALAMERWGRRLDACGLVLPIVHVAEGAPSLRATLYDHLAQEPCITAEGGRVLRPDQEERVKARITSVTPGGDGLALHFDIQCPDDYAARAEALARLTGRGVTRLAHRLSGYDSVAFKFPLGTAAAALPKKAPPVKDLTMADIDLHHGRVMGYEAWKAAARRLKRVPGLDVYRAGTSFYGREIYAVEPECTLPGYVSTVKRVARNPSLLICGRHHANEVSASNAVMLLLEALVTQPGCRDLAGRLNLALIPMENPDGAALHDELQREHPLWQHHTCYAVPSGRDLCAMYFEEGPLNAEGRALTEIYRRLLPDAIIDLHGVPHHDWQHQFTSLTGYKGLWVPRALICAFYWYADDGRYVPNRVLSRAWADAVAEAYFDHPAIQEQNRLRRQRFDTYAYNGISLDFPCALENKMLNYWIPAAYHPKYPYFSVRFPWITAVSFTAEAADETAQGPSLERCAEAHLAHIRAGIDFCLRAGRPMERSRSGTEARAVRRRPLLPPGKND